MRDRPAERLVAEAEQVGERAAAARDDHDIHVAQRGEVPERAGDRRRRMTVLHRRESPHEPSGPAAPAERGEHVVAGLARLARDDADRARERGERQLLLAREQALGVELLAQPVDLREQVALAGDAQVA